MESNAMEQEKHIITIMVHNEDSGKSFELKGESTDLVQIFIDKLYEAFRSTRKPSDRLFCGAAKINVFSYEGLSITDFERQHCEAHEWTFAGETGGALCCPFQ